MDLLVDWLHYEIKELIMLEMNTKKYRSYHETEWKLTSYSQHLQRLSGCNQLPFLGYAFNFIDFIVL